jgi:hypothetical protein
MRDGIHNAIIDSANLSTADYDTLVGWVHLDYGGMSQGFGGLALYLPRSFKHHKIDSGAGHWIYRVMEIAGVTDWSKLKGKTVRARIENGLVAAIGHIVKDDWFCPREDFASKDEAA